MGKAGRMPFCEASNPAAASPKVTNAAITTTTVFVASSARPRAPLKNRSEHAGPGCLYDKAQSRLFSETAGRGNVGSSRTAGNRIVEIALAGWGGRIRTLGSREAASRAWLDRNGGAIGAPYSLQNGPNGLDRGASHSLAAQPGKVSDRSTFRNEGKFGPHFTVFMPMPKRMRTMRFSRGVSDASARVVVSPRFDWIAASIGRIAFLSSIKSPRWLDGKSYRKRTKTQ
jgi:hypothetical protein